MSNDQYCVIKIRWWQDHDGVTSMKREFWYGQRFDSIDAARDAICLRDDMASPEPFNTEYNYFIHGDHPDLDLNECAPKLWPLRDGEARFFSESGEDQFTEYRVVPETHLTIEPRWLVTYCRVKHAPTDLPSQPFNTKNDYTIDDLIRDCRVSNGRSLTINHSNDGERIDVWDRRLFMTLILGEIAA
jgi:hypothetical protein